MKNEHLTRYVEKNLRACQLKQQGILDEVDRICKKHDIEYWLDGGTMLGAVRHGGFIPWDDDIDVAMTVEGLRRFCEVAPGELREGLMLQTQQTEPESKEPIVKVRDLNSLYIEGGDVFSADYQKGLYVDFFPFEPCPDMNRKLFKRITKAISKSYSILHSQHYYSLRAVAEWFWFGAQYLTCSALLKVCKLIYPCSQHLSNIPINNGYGILHHRDTIFPLGSIEFEGKMYPAPARPHEFLQDLYGDYMQIPPVEKRKIHAIFIEPELN